MTSQLDEIKKIFEYEIKRKLSERARSTIDEFRILMNGFKFYDYTKSGKVNQTEFVKGILRTGLSGFNDSDIFSIFNCYDINKTGYIDYKNFCNYLYGREPLIPLTNSDTNSKSTEIPNNNTEQVIKLKTPININQRRKTPFNIESGNLSNINNNQQEQLNTKEIPQTQNQIQQDQQNIDPNQTKEYFQKLINSIKEKIHTNNGLTYYSFLNELKNISDQNQNISLDNLINAFKNTGLNLVQNEIINFFNIIDFSGAGKISIDDIINTIVEPLNEERKLYVVNKFSKLDIEKQGEVKVSLLKEKYNPKRHPDVISAKISEEEIFKQFSFTLDTYCRIKNINEMISYKQFIDYYSGISSSISDNKYFIEILDGVWDIDNNNNNEQANNNKINNNIENNLQQEQNKINEQNNNLNKGRRRQYMNNYSNNIFDNQNNNNIRYNQRNNRIPKQNFENGFYDENTIGINSLFFGKSTNVATKNFGKKSFKKMRSDFDQNSMYFSEYKNQYQNNQKANNNKSTEFVENKHSRNNDKTLISPSQSLPIVNSEPNNQFKGKNSFNDIWNNNRQNRSKMRYNPITNEYSNEDGSITDAIQDKNIKTSLNQINNNNIGRKYNINNNETSSINNTTANTIGTQNNNNIEPEKNEEQILKNSLDKLKNTLILRGSHSIFSFQRKLSFYDMYHQGQIFFKNFENIIQAYAMNISPEEIKIIFDLFDKEKTGSINYNELIQTIIGEVNPKRKLLIQKIFENFKKDSNGKVSISEIKLLFNPRRHPDVINGIKREGEIFGDFLDNIESYKEYLENLTGVFDNSFSLEEFINFFNEMGIAINDDKKFEIILNNCWNFGNNVDNTNINNMNRNKYGNNGYEYRNNKSNNRNLIARAGSQIISNNIF